MVECLFLEGEFSCAARVRHMNTLFAALPEVVEDYLDDGAGNQLTASAINRNGTLLAIGTHEGRTNIWDMYTRTICKVLVGHVRPVTSLSWSYTGRYLATGSLDTCVRVWDLVTTNFAFSKQFETMVLSCDWHPTNPDLLLVVFWMKKHPVILNFKTGQETEVKAMPRGEEEGDYCVATWNSTGNKLYKGNNKGLVTVIDANTLTVESWFVVASNVAVKGFSFSKDENQFLVNATDKIIRVYSTDDNGLLWDLSVAVDKPQWKNAAFFGEDYISAFSSETAGQTIYFWSRSCGQLIKILDGPKDVVLDFTFHPTRNMLVTCAVSGIAYVWSKPQSENWSAYAPGFTELEENEEYVEREDEFDEPDTEEELVKAAEAAKAKQQVLDAGEIDIGEESFGDDNEEKDVEFLLTTHPIPDYLILAATELRQATPKKRQIGGKDNRNTKKKKTEK